MAIKSIHIVDDDPIVLESVAMLLRVLGHKTMVYGSGTAFLDDSQVQPGDRLLFDLHMPDIDLSLIHI